MAQTKIEGTEPWVSAAETLLDRHDIALEKHRKSMSGVALHVGGIEAPEPRGAKSYAIFAHEVGHKVLHSDNGAYPRWREEIEAWDFALASFSEFDLSGQRKIRPWVAKKIARSVHKARVKDRGKLIKEFRRDYPGWARNILDL
jgi:hypothetical protein